MSNCPEFVHRIFRIGKDAADEVTKRAEASLLRANPGLSRPDGLPAGTLLAIPDVPHRGGRLELSDEVSSRRDLDRVGKQVRHGLIQARDCAHRTANTAIKDAQDIVAAVNSPLIGRLVGDNSHLQGRVAQIQQSATARLDEAQNQDTRQQQDFDALSQSLDRVFPARVSAIRTLSLESATVNAGGSSVGVVTLSRPAPARGATVYLTTSNPAVVSVPQEIVVPAHEIDTTFNLQTTMAAARDSSIAIFAQFAGDTRKAVLLVGQAVDVPRERLQEIELDVRTSRSGTLKGRVTLDQPATAEGAVVHLSADSDLVTVRPTNLHIAAGKTSSRFDIETTPVDKKRKAVIKAVLGDDEKTLKVVLRPPKY